MYFHFAHLLHLRPLPPNTLYLCSLIFSRLLHYCPLLSHLSHDFPGTSVTLNLRKDSITFFFLLSPFYPSFCRLLFHSTDAMPREIFILGSIISPNASATALLFNSHSKHQVDCPFCHLMSDLVICKHRKQCGYMHGAECPYWDQVS